MFIYKMENKTYIIKARYRKPLALRTKCVASKFCIQNKALYFP